MEGPVLCQKMGEQHGGLANGASTTGQDQLAEEAKNDANKLFKGNSPLPRTGNPWMLVGADSVV